MLTEIKSLFEGENMQAQYSLLVYRIDFNFHCYSNRNIDYGIKRQIAIEQELGFIRIDHDKEDFDILKAINEMFRHIKQSSKKI